MTYRHPGGLMSFMGIFRSIGRRFDQYCLEAACETAINIWQREKPEYIDKIRRWIDSDQIPEDNDLMTLCRVYQERLRPRPCYHHTKT